MADDDLKLQQPVDENNVPDIPEPETEGIPEDSSSEAREPIPTPPVSSARRDIWREQRWKDILSKEERTQRCSRCREIGHAHIHCPYPFYPVKFLTEAFPVPMVWRPPKGKYRCSRCGRRGHNRRTCHGPVCY
ncbi:uncharacterized protein LOC108473013 [Gossypium arboreum]|uniref:uncharacterized protein LOC108473013 n=1 Tax=Gossypium arboreum TaxID=29729 RepID=UPI0008193109|nr:uncharacterized protein LOC108473013 [Gossypium arboreum]